MILYVCGCNSFSSVKTYGYLYLSIAEASLTYLKQDFMWATSSWLPLACAAPHQEQNTTSATGAQPLTA